MNSRLAVLAVMLLTGCTTNVSETPTVSVAPKAADVPAEITFDRQWTTVDGGYVYTAGYFREAETQSVQWEAKRVAASNTFAGCAEKRVISRDVRWFQPSGSGPQCARIVYTVLCAPQRPGATAALAYARRGQLLEEPESPLPTTCGEGGRTVRPANAPAPLSQSPAAISETAECGSSADLHEGRFILGEVNYFNATVVASPSYSELAPRLLQADPIFFVRNLAGRERKIHLVRVARPLPNDNHSLFVEQVNAIDGVDSCVQLTVRQGPTIWRKTIRRTLAVVDRPGQPPRLRLAAGIHLDAKALQIDLARHLGIRVPTKMADPSWPASSTKPRGITIR